MGLGVLKISQTTGLISAKLGTKQTCGNCFQDCSNKEPVISLKEEIIKKKCKKELIFKQEPLSKIQPNLTQCTLGGWTFFAQIKGFAGLLHQMLRL